MKKQATRVRNYADILISELDQLGYSITTDKANHFDTVVVNVKSSGLQSADQVVSEFHKFGINIRRIDDSQVGVSFNETNNLIDLDELIEIFADLKFKTLSPSSGFLTDKFYENRKYNELPKNLARSSAFLEQPQFKEITSETQMMRYIQRLADKDVGLTNSMIPLGSCTLKLNSAIEMLPVTFDGFGGIHPFAPND